MPRVGRQELAGKSIQREQLARLASTAEIGKARENSQCAGERQAELLQFHCNLTGQNRSGGSSENSDAVRLVSFQQLFVYGDNIVDGGGERILRGEPVIDGHNPYFR